MNENAFNPEGTVSMRTIQKTLDPESANGTAFHTCVLMRAKLDLSASLVTLLNSRWLRRRRKRKDATRERRDGATRG